MAESCNQAFGRYLRILRERRGLSLDDVSSLSQAFPERLNKGYLSRCENGHQRLAFSKLIPLSRIYEVPPDVLVERMELDLELDRLGGPETAGLSFEQLRDRGRQAMNEGFHWNAYAYVRDAVARADTGKHASRYRDLAEQYGVAQMNCATAALALGRAVLAYHEFTTIGGQSVLGARFQALMLERLAECERRFGNWAQSRHNADLAIESAREAQDSVFLGYAHSNRALLASEEQDWLLARQQYEKAYTLFKKAEMKPEQARTLNNIAQIYFDTGRFASARRALLAAEKLAIEAHHQRAIALGRILLGQIEAAEGKPRLAMKLFREASDLARELQDQVIRFKAEFRMFELSKLTGDLAVCRAVERRLRRQSPSLPDYVAEVREFREQAS